MNTRQFRFDARFEETSLEIALSGDLPNGPVARCFGSPEHVESVPVVLRSNILRYEWDDPLLSMSWDFAALLSVLSFEPVLSHPSTSATIVRFGWPVSEQALAAITEWQPTIEVESLRGGVPTVPERGPVISFGGGIDSTALTRIFPDVELAHELPLGVRTGRIKSAVFDRFNHRTDMTFVYTNQRELYDVWGLGSWLAIFAGALLLNPAAILSGQNILASSFLRAHRGESLRVRHMRWYRLMSGFGPRMTTMEFMTSLCNARIVTGSGLIHETAYCPSIRLDDCGACPKCLRRRVLFELADPGGSPRPLADFAPTAETLADLETSKYTPNAAILGIERSLVPAWLATRVYPNFGHLVGHVNFIERYLGAAIGASGYTEDEKIVIEDRLASWGISPMTASDRAEIAAISPENAKEVLSETFVQIG